MFSLGVLFCPISNFGIPTFSQKKNGYPRFSNVGRYQPTACRLFFVPSHGPMNKLPILRPCCMDSNYPTDLINRTRNLVLCFTCAAALSCSVCAFLRSRWVVWISLRRGIVLAILSEWLYLAGSCGQVPSSFFFRPSLFLFRPPLNRP